jgi:hypothetical protein
VVEQPEAHVQGQLRALIQDVVDRVHLRHLGEVVLVGLVGRRGGRGGRGLPVLRRAGHHAALGTATAPEPHFAR